MVGMPRAPLVSGTQAKTVGVPSPVVNDPPTPPVAGKPPSVGVWPPAPLVADGYSPVVAGQPPANPAVDGLVLVVTRRPPDGAQSPLLVLMAITVGGVWPPSLVNPPAPPPDVAAVVTDVPTLTAGALAALDAGGRPPSFTSAAPVSAMLVLSM